MNTCPDHPHGCPAVGAAYVVHLTHSNIGGLDQLQQAVADALRRAADSTGGTVAVQHAHPPDSAPQVPGLADAVELASAALGLGAAGLNMGAAWLRGRARRG